MKLSTIVKAIHGQLYGEDFRLPPIAIDSRKIKGGELFIALRGESHDGHEFIADAISQGAVAVLAERAPQNEREKSVSFIQVADTTKALGEMAAYFRSLYPIPMVGLTGSCGKTTVKGMIESICQQEGKTLATQGNFNNHVGLPLTLLRLDPSYQFAIIEMGANHMGEIGYLGKIAKPTVSLINNVRPAHLEGFGSIEGVAKAKGEIYEVLPRDGTAILNLEESFCDHWRTLIKDRKVITFGLKKEAMIYATDISLQANGASFMLHTPQGSQQVNLPIPGQHTVLNALAATAAGVALGISLPKIVAGLEQFQGVPGRLRQVTGLKGAVVIDDTYNANPGSMMAALEVLATCPGEKIFVMGDMGELGPDTISYHAQIGHFARNKKISRLYAVGKLSQHAVEAFGEGATLYPSKEALVADLKPNLNGQTFILVKGSRSARMEQVTHALTGKE